MEQFRSLHQRPLEKLLRLSATSRSEGLVVMRDREGLRHGVFMHGGFVVGVHVAGRFDPLLDGLRQRGVIDEAGYRACLGWLGTSERRSGALAVEVCGALRSEVREALKQQTRARMAALLEVSRHSGHDARFEPGHVSAAKIGIRMPLGALHVEQDGQPRRAATTDAQARQRLRALARKLHPDLHPHADSVQRRQLEEALAAATAAYHGLTHPSV